MNTINKINKNPKKWLEKSFQSDIKNYDTINKGFYESNLFLEKTQNGLLNIMKEYVKNTDANILDAGCGTGGFLIAAASDHYEKIYGIDVHRKSILRAVARFKIYNKEVNIIQGNAIKMPFKNDFFDFIVCVGMIEHIIGRDKRQKIMNEFFRILKPGGFIFLITHPNKYFPYDMHYGLPFINWLPKKLKFYIAKKFAPDRVSNIFVTSNVSEMELISYIKRYIESYDSVWWKLLEYNLRFESKSPKSDPFLGNIGRFINDYKLVNLVVLISKILCKFSLSLSICLVIKKKI